MFTLGVIGIHAEEITRGVYIAESALEEAELSKCIDDLNEAAINELRQTGDWDNITDSVIQAYFETAKVMIEEKSSHTCTYCVNGWDSHFAIDDDEVFPHREF